MPAALPYSSTVGEAVLKRLAAGEGLKKICADRDMPCVETIKRWARATPHFARRLRQARELWRRHRLARLRPRAPTPELIGEICARIECGEGLRAMCQERAHLPRYRAVLTWVHEHPEFARRYRAALERMKAQRRYTPRRDAEAAVDEICARLVRGESLKAICRDPAMPGGMTVWHWRRNIPGVDRRIREALHELAPARLRPSSYSPAVDREICRRLAAGEALKAICRSPHMPCVNAVYEWMKLSPPFATRCAEAREVAEDRWHGELRAALRRAGDGPGGDVSEVRAALRRPRPPRARKYRL